MVKNEKLIKLSYDDYKSEVHLEVHADTVVMESVDNAVYVAAVRFGGYPEMVRGMADAMYGGGQICIHIGEKMHFLKCHVKQYRREVSHDGIYAEATLMVQDEEQSTELDEDDSGNANNYNRPRKCYLFCERDDIAV